MRLERKAGLGWIVLLGGGEFSFGETEDADEAWLEKTSPDGLIGFVPAASGSDDYGRHFATYLQETFGRRVEVIPLYRQRDGRRGRNAERLAAVDAIYLGGGVPDHLLDTLFETPAADAIAARVAAGGTLVAIGAAAQTLGQVARSLFGGKLIEGLGILPAGAIECNFDPSHDRRLRQMMGHAAVTWGVGIPADSALFLGPTGEIEVLGTVYVLDHPDGDYAVLR